MSAAHRLRQSARGILSVLFIGCLLMTVLHPGRAEAAVSYVQGIGTISTTSVSLTSAATAGNLLVVICSDNVSSTITGPGGYTSIINESGTVSQAIFYKIAAGGERTGIGCTFTGSGTEGVQVLEYSGLHTYMTVEGSTSTNGSSATVGTGTLATTHASDLLIAAGISNGQNQVNWGGSFTNRTHDELTKGNPSNRAAISSADQLVGSTGSYSGSASAANAAWRGQIVAFRAMAASPALLFDFVDGSGTSVASPSATLGTISPSFACQTVTGTLGTTTQKFRITNTTDNPAWTLAMAATAGPTATWYSAGPPVHSYAFNNPAGSPAGCSNGQLTVNPAAGTLTAQTNCSTSGVSTGSSAGFVVGPPSAVTILSAASPAYIDCYYELTGVALSQKVPPGQLGGSYSLGMTLTITAN